MANRGQNNGLTGTIIAQMIDGGTVSTNTPICVNILSYDMEFLPDIVTYTGTGSGFAPQVYGSNVGATAEFSGLVQSSQAPFPAFMQNLAGTMVFQKDTNCTVSMPVVLSNISCALDATKQETWTISGTVVKNGQATIGWAGPATVPWSPAIPLAQWTYAGTAITGDPNTLTSNIQQRVFFPLSYTASASQAESAINSYIGGILPLVPSLQHHHHLTTRIDDAVIWLDIFWAYNSTVQDLTLPETQTDIDPGSLNSSARTAAIDATPNSVSGFTLRSTTSVPKTPAHTLSIAEYGLVSTVNERQFPGTFVFNDPQSLNTSGQQVIVANSTAPSVTVPSGLKISGQKYVQVTDSLGATNNQFETTAAFAINDSKDTIQLGGTSLLVDPQSINTSWTGIVVDGSPSIPSGYSLQSYSTVSRTLTITGHVSNEVVAKLNNSAQEVLFRGSKEYRSPRGYTSDEMQLVTPTDNLSNMADNLWADFQTESYAIGLTLVQLTPGLMAVTYSRLNPGYTVEGWVTGGGRVQESRLDGSGNPQLYIVQNVPRGTGGRQITFSKYRRRKSCIRRFVLWRHIIGSTLPEQSPSTIDGVTLPLIGNTNNGSFLNLAAGTCIYEGPTYVVNFALLGSNTAMFIGYQFYSDADGIIDGVQEGLFDPNGLLLATSTTATGWTTVSAISSAPPFSDITTPSQASFAAFLS